VLIGRKLLRLRVATSLDCQYRTSEIAVVLVSAYARLVEDCTSRGASGCIEKPFDIDSLLSEVRGVLHQPSEAAMTSREERQLAQL
jgi:hypothetical protein